VKFVKNVLEQIVHGINTKVFFMYINNLSDGTFAITGAGLQRALSSPLTQVSTATHPQNWSKKDFLPHLFWTPVQNRPVTFCLKRFFAIHVCLKMMSNSKDVFGNVVLGPRVKIV
jgi:hypothetical protein